MPIQTQSAASHRLRPGSYTSSATSCWLAYTNPSLTPVIESLPHATPSFTSMNAAVATVSHLTYPQSSGPLPSANAAFTTANAAFDNMKDVPSFQSHSMLSNLQTRPKSRQLNHLQFVPRENVSACRTSPSRPCATPPGSSPACRTCARQETRAPTPGSDRPLSASRSPSGSTP